MKTEVYVLAGRCGFNSLCTSASVNLIELRKEMAEAFEFALDELDGNYEEPGTSCGDDEATIVTSGDWYEWAITTHIIDCDSPVSFTLPNGVMVKAALNGGKTEMSRHEWKSVDVYAIYPDGKREPLCAVDWENGLGTRAIVYDSIHEDPAYTHFYKAVDEFAPVLREVNISELASLISSLKDGDSLRFYADKDETGGSELYGATRVYAFDASHILFNYYGGSSPYLVDVTTAEDEVKLVEEALNSYFDYCGIEAPVYLIVEYRKGFEENE